MGSAPRSRPHRPRHGLALALGALGEITLCGTLRPTLAQMPREEADRRKLEERHDRRLVADERGQPCVQLEKQQRMTAEIEEARVDADVVDLEKLLPEAGDASLELASRRSAGRDRRGRRACGAARGCGERAL